MYDVSHDHEHSVGYGNDTCVSGDDDDVNEYHGGDTCGVYAGNHNVVDILRIQYIVI